MPPSRKRKSNKKEPLSQQEEEEQDRKPAAKKTTPKSPPKSEPKASPLAAKEEMDASSSLPSSALAKLPTQTKKDDDEEEEASLDIAACSLCHCALDYSDKAAFFASDRQEDYHEDSDSEDYFFRPTDPYLPAELHNHHNALVYCDTCERLYHQKCHFVPILQVPRGNWKCLVCTSCTTSSTKPAASRKRKSTKSASPNNNTRNWTQDTSKLFLSPPIPESRALEQAWELQVAPKKAHLLHTSMKRLKDSCAGQLSLIRLAQAALQTYSTARNRKHFDSQSQELKDTAVKLWTAKYKLKQALTALHGVIVQDSEFTRLTEWTDQYLQNAKTGKERAQRQEFVTRVLFPFGRNHARRTQPRTAEQHDNGGDDDGISLDDLTCSVCLTSSATDDNDLVLCDGQGCCRAYHYECVVPTLSAEKLNDDWFCPLCLGLAETMLLIQTEYNDTDWEQRRLAAHIENASLTESLQSWSNVQEVFPESNVEYEAACALREGQRNATTDALLANLLGYEQESDEANGQDDDEEEDEEDDHFDLDSYQEQRRQELEGEKNDKDDGSSSSHSSQATLVDMSSVELEIGKDELAALSDKESDDDDNENGGRKSRRLRQNRGGNKNNNIDPGKLDASNILMRKRGRKPVDYIRLNEAIFGDLSDTEVEKIDDREEFTASKSRDEDDSRHGQEDDDDESSGSGNGSAESEEDEQDSDDGGPATNGRSKAGASKGKSTQKERVLKKPPTNGRKKKKTETDSPKGAKLKTKKQPSKQSKGKAKKPSRPNGKH